MGALLHAAATDAAIDRAGSRGSRSAVRRRKAGPRKAKCMAPWLDADAAGRATGFDEYVPAFLTGSGSIRATLASKSAVDAMPDIANIMQREADRCSPQERRKAILTAEATGAILTIATALIDRYEDYKHRNDVDYDDLILRARCWSNGRHHGCFTSSTAGSITC